MATKKRRGNSRQKTPMVHKEFFPSNNKGKTVATNGKTSGASVDQLESIKKDLERQRDERIDAILTADPTLRELNGALKGIQFALEGPGEEPEAELEKTSE